MYNPKSANHTYSSQVSLSVDRETEASDLDAIYRAMYEQNRTIRTLDGFYSDDEEQKEPETALHQEGGSGLTRLSATFAANVYSKDLIITRGTRQMGGHTAPKKQENYARKKAKREAIKEFSYKAKRRAVTTFRNTQEGRYEKHKKPLCNAVDLTYPMDYSRDGKVIKEHLHKFLLWINKRGGLYEWVLEFQYERGLKGWGFAPHFHILTNIFIPKRELSRKWYEIVGSGDIKHLHSGTHVEGIRDVAKKSTYLVNKYLLKKEQKDVPADYKNVGRFWGYSLALLEIEKLFTEHYHLNTSVELSRLQERQRVEYLRSLRRWYVAHCRGWPKRMRPKKLGKRLSSLGKVFRGGRYFHDEYMKRVSPLYLFTPLPKRFI